MGLSQTEAADVAHGWSSVMTWSDPGVCLYAFASTGGRVQSERHRADCLAYIQVHCRRAADTNVAAGAFLDSHEELDALRAHIVAAPVRKP